MIVNEKGKPYLIQGPPTVKPPEYWDLGKVKYINFDNYGHEEVKRQVEIPKIVPREPLKVPEVVTPQKIEIRVEKKNVPKISVESEILLSEDQVSAKIKGISGAPVVYQEAITKEEYRVYARALDLPEKTVYCDKAEFDIFFPKVDDLISCDFISTKWTIREVSKIGSIIQIKVG